MLSNYQSIEKHNMFREECLFAIMKLFHKSKKHEDAYLLLKQDIEKTTSDLRAAYTNLENVVDPDLIDYYIYQAKAAQMRYKFLLSCVKKLEDSYTKNPL